MERYLKKFQKGDIKSYNIIISKIEKRLYMIAKSKLLNEEDAKDACQETFIAIYNEIGNLNDISKFNAWVTVILINNCNKIIKSKIRNENLQEKILLNNNEKNLEEKSEFFSIIKNLDEDERVILSMYYSDKYTTKEISEILKINENTIRSKISRAKIKLRKELDIGG